MSNDAREVMVKDDPDDGLDVTELSPTTAQGELQNAFSCFASCLAPTTWMDVDGEEQEILVPPATGAAYNTFMKGVSTTANFGAIDTSVTTSDVPVLSLAPTATGGTSATETVSDAYNNLMRGIFTTTNLNKDDTFDAYNILGVSKNATTATIRKKYIQEARKSHPDLGINEADIQKRTFRMFELNAAHDILRDSIRRSKHDADLIRVGKKDRGAGYSQKGPFNFPTKPGLAVPYQGPRTIIESYCCDADGIPGTDGAPGTQGQPGVMPGSRGGDGGNAGFSTSGTDAQNMKIYLRVSAAKDGHSELDIGDVRQGDEDFDQTKNNMKSVPLKVFGSLDFTAEGGRGGHGGVGGKGGAGAIGKKGRGT